MHKQQDVTTSYGANSTGSDKQREAGDALIITSQGLMNNYNQYLLVYCIRAGELVLRGEHVCNGVSGLG